MNEQINKFQDSIKVLLADDHTLFREGIRQMLETDPLIQVVGGAADGEEAIHLARQTQPDVVLLDLEMPKMGGEEAIGQLLRISSSPRILILSVKGTAPLLQRLLARGASGYISKIASAEELLAAVHNAVEYPRNPNGDNTIVVAPPKVLESIEKEEAPLSARELEVLLLTARGLSRRQIAGSLVVSEATVKRHLSNIYSKMKMSNRSEAVKKALFETWLTVEDIN